LIATDLDHTLLDETGRVAPRTRDALDAARSAGVFVVPVTARQPIGLRAIEDQTGFTDWALCSNGAFAIHLTSGEVLFTQEAPASVLQTLTAALNERIPDLLYASVRNAGSGLIAQHGYDRVARHEDHKRDPASIDMAPLAEVLAE